MVTALPVAVKGPTVCAVEGTDKVTPAEGTGLGMVTVKSSGPTFVVAGVAPVASTLVTALPVMAVFPRAAAAAAMAAGMSTTV
jgi:hypothetical protein